MIVLGDISGIQSYVFDVVEAGGGQARRLRARSFYVQLLAETAALRVRRALGWGPEAVLLCGAGKFTLRGSHPGAADELLAAEQQAISDWLRKETRGELRITVAWANAGESESADYRTAQFELQSRKARPWAPASGAPWFASARAADTEAFPTAGEGWLAGGASGGGALDGQHNERSTPGRALCDVLLQPRPCRTHPLSRGKRRYRGDLLGRQFHGEVSCRDKRTNAGPMHRRDRRIE